jgi:quercetin dioxygenase-like cupin family protein
MHAFFERIRAHFRPRQQSALPADLPMLRSAIYSMPLPLPANAKEPWKPCHFFRGITPNQLALSCHASALLHGHCPHPPHIHDEEELLLVLHGEVEVNIPRTGGSGRRCLKAGEFVYYPRDFPHTLTTFSEQPANYLMFKWSAAHTTGGNQLAFGQYEVEEPSQEHPQVAGYYSRLLFEGSTRYLGKLHCHLTRLAPGSGYDVHVDKHDIAIVFLRGECETLGQRVVANSIIYYAAGEPHGIRNVGEEAALYIVFEFHRPS